MIFRTITDDITGANKSIGLFGKSLENVKNVLYSFQTNGIKNTLFNTPLSNIDTKAIDSYNNAIRSSVPFERALAIARRTTNAETVALIESTNGAEVQLESLTAVQKASTLAAKAHSAALKAVSIAGNMILFTVIAKGIQLATKAFDDYIHRVDRARERTEELFSEFKEMNTTLADHKKTVTELADRYDELSKGVNLSNNDNISLSTEEYEEFLDINEQMAQSFPELAKGIDENGNSILTLGTKGITAKEQLEELLQTEEDLNNFRIAQGLEDAFKGVYTYVEDANEATEKLNGMISDSSEAMGKLQDIAENGINLTGDNGQLIFAGNINNQAEIDYMNSLTQSVNEFWKSLDGNRRVELGVDPSYLFTQQFDEYTGAFEIYANLYQLTPEEITALENIIQDNVGDASGALLDSISDQSQELQEQIQQGENAWRDFIPNLVSGMKSKQTFKDLDSDLQDIAVQIVEGLDYSYATAMKEYDPDPYAYVRDKFIVPMGNLSDSDKQKLQSSFEELFKLDAENISQSNQAEIEKLITTIADLLNKEPLEIRVALGFDTKDVQKRYNEALKQAKRQLGGYGHDDKGFEVNNSVGNQIDSFWSENVVTEEDWALWQKVTAGIDNATEAMEAYTEAKKNANSVKLDEAGIFSSFSDTDLGERIQHITNLFNEGSISHKEYFDALQSEINNFDASNFTDSLEEANAASQQFFTDSVQQTASGLSSLINKFDSGSIGISEYLEGYLSIAETMSVLTDELQKNSEAWDENGNALSNASNSALDSTQENMANAISVIQSYQDSIYSLEQIMTGTIEAGSNEFAAHAEVIAEDLARIVATGGEMADEISSVLGTTTAEIAQSLTESVSNQSLASQAIAANTNTAIGDMANSIGELFNTLGNAISNFKVDVSFGIKKISAQDVDMGILGTHKLPKIDFALEANGQSLDAIGSAISSFGKTISSNLKPQMIELPDFTFGNTEAGKNSTYKPSPGITKNYEDAFDKIKESAKDASNSAKDSADDIKSQFEEIINFFDRRVNVLDNALSLLKTNLDNVTGSFAKNNLINAELGVTEEKFKNYSDALNMYTQKANEALSKLPSDIAAKIKDGAVDLTTFVGDGNKEVVEAIKDYEQWADKVADCKQELAELQTAIRQLELEKFNNIMEDFTNQFDLHQDGKDLISKQIDLLKEAGELIGESFFTTQIDQSKKQLELLETEKVKLVEQMNSAIGSGRVQKGTEEWLSMVNALSDVEGNILDCKKAIEEFDNELLQLHWDIFDRIQEQFKDLDSELSNLGKLFDDFKVTDSNFNWSKEGLAQLGLLTQQYELAEYQVQQYNDEINQLSKDYLAGKYSAVEYADRLSELSSAQWDAVNSSESIKDAIVDLNEVRINEEIDAIEKEIDAYRELIDSQIKALQSEKD